MVYAGLLDYCSFCLERIYTVGRLFCCLEKFIRCQKIFCRFFYIPACFFDVQDENKFDVQDDNSGLSRIKRSVRIYVPAY